MEIIYNQYIPFKGFTAINLFGVLFVRTEYKNKLKPTTLNHEAIHTAQMKEMLYLFFYLWYLIEWIVRLFRKNAYRNISFEREAYKNESNVNYLKTRKRFNFLKYV